MIEIMLAAGEVEEARRTSDELDAIARGLGTDALMASAAHAHGAVALAQADCQAAIEPLRNARSLWRKVGAPYVIARARVLLGRAFRELGDDDGAELEFAAARQVFEQLGAAPDLAALGTLGVARTRSANLALSPRELQVLRLLASGKTNKAIARELRVSDRTIDRHLSNIFAKIGVNTRTAATAFAYEHRLV
ncbi:MAG TPA: LuxR C-terminal-related transcriptional regulator [Steroidobacteraceae bacterium]|nr:LuxR C-terminal-related transcriptional regulator [Steroidobacteraceae bacterium]